MSEATRTYGTVSSEARKEMTGLEFVQGLANRTLPLNTIAKTLGYDVTEAEAGRVVVAITPTADHLNPAGTVHGGLTATLLDSCMGLAVQSTLEKDMSQTTLEFKISLLRPITPAGSTDRRNTFGELLSWGLIEQGLSRPFIELPCDRVELGLAVQGQIGAPRKILAQQSVGVFA